MSELPAVSSLRTVGEHVELDLGEDLADSPRYNDDIAPTRAAQRTWSRWNVASLWVGMAICVPDLHARRRADGLLRAVGERSAVDDPDRQRRRADSADAECVSGHALRHPLPRRAARVVRHHRLERTVADPRARRLRLVRRADAVRRHRDSPAAVGDVRQLGGAGRHRRSHRLLHLLDRQHHGRHPRFRIDQAPRALAAPLLLVVAIGLVFWALPKISSARYWPRRRTDPPARRSSATSWRR